MIEGRDRKTVGALVRDLRTHGEDLGQIEKMFKYMTLVFLRGSNEHLLNSEINFGTFDVISLASYIMY